MFSDHNRIQLKMSNKIPQSWETNTLQNNPWDKEEMKRKLQRILH